MEFINDRRNKSIAIKTLLDCCSVQLASEDYSSQNISNDSSIHSDSFLFSNVKAKLANMKDVLKFNVISLNTSLTISPNQHLFLYNKHYNTNIASHMEAFHKKLSSILYFSYKKNFPFIPNIKSKTYCSSDSGWGCMIRSSQMILSRAIYKILKHLNKHKQTFSSKEDILDNVMTLFVEYPYMRNNIPKLYMNYILKAMDVHQINSPHKKVMHIISVFPPFGIKAICAIGEIFDKTAGEWFSDVNMPRIMDIINGIFNVIPTMKVFSFISSIVKHPIITECFSRNVDNALDPNDYIEDSNGKLYLMKCGVVFVSVRLGMLDIAEEYYPSILQLFECKQCIGFVGGKRESAHYFIGHNGENCLMYLDPHYAMESVFDNDDKEEMRKVYLNKQVYLLKLQKLECAFTIGFVFRNCGEFKEMIKWIEEYKKREFACFDYYEKPLVSKGYRGKKEVLGFVEVESDL